MITMIRSFEQSLVQVFDNTDARITLPLATKLKDLENLLQSRNISRENTFTYEKYFLQWVTINLKHELVNRKRSSNQ